MLKFIRLLTLTLLILLGAISDGNADRINDSGNLPSVNLNFLSGTLPSNVQFSRASSATYFDATGNLQTAGTNQPRFDYGPFGGLKPLGLLIEPQSTNGVPNNTNVGAVVGTPGTLPTGYAINTLNGLSSSVVGFSTFLGINYLDIRIFGTTTTGSFTNISLAPGSATAVLNGQTWTTSSYLAIVAGSTTNINQITLGSSVLDSSLSYLGELSVRPNLKTLLTNGLVRFSGTGTIAFANAAFAGPYIQVSYPSGGGIAIDITLRIGMPQLEQQNYATSVIATSGTAVTRAVDNAWITPYFFNANNYSIWASYQLEGIPTPGNSSKIVGLSDGSVSNRIDYGPTGATLLNTTAVKGGVSQFSLNTSNSLTVGNFLTSYASRSSTRAFVGFGSIAIAGTFNSTTSVGFPVPGINRLDIGANRGGNSQLGGWIAKLKLWNKTLSDSQLRGMQ